MSDQMWMITRKNLTELLGLLRWSRNNWKRMAETWPYYDDNGTRKVSIYGSFAKLRKRQIAYVKFLLGGPEVDRPPLVASPLEVVRG